MSAAHPLRRPRNLTQLIARDAQVDSALMAEVCKVGFERWLKVREQAGADHAAGVRPERGDE